MTRQEYLSELDSHLISLPDEEREMAINFYTEYFDEAGSDNEASVMDELGKPFQLAKSIISEQSAYSKSEVYIKYRESNPIEESGGVYVSMKKESVPYNPVTYTSAAAVSDEVKEQINAGSVEQDVMPANTVKQDDANTNNYHIKFDDVEPKSIPEETYTSSGQNTYNQNNNGYDYSYQDYKSPFTDTKPKKKHSYTGLKITLLVLFIVFIFCPVILPIICIMAGFLIMCVVLILAAIVVFILGIVKVFANPLTGLGTMFASLLCAGIGILMFVPCLLFFAKTLPWFFKGWAKLMKDI